MKRAWTTSTIKTFKTKASFIHAYGVSYFGLRILFSIAKSEKCDFKNSTVVLEEQISY